MLGNLCEGGGGVGGGDALVHVVEHLFITQWQVSKQYIAADEIANDDSKNHSKNWIRASTWISRKRRALKVTQPREPSATKHKRTKTFQTMV